MAGNTADMTQKPGSSPIIFMGQTSTPAFASDPDTPWQKAPASAAVQTLTIKG